MKPVQRAPRARRRTAREQFAILDPWMRAPAARQTVTSVAGRSTPRPPRRRARSSERPLRADSARGSGFRRTFRNASRYASPMLSRSGPCASSTYKSSSKPRRAPRLVEVPLKSDLELLRARADREARPRRRQLFDQSSGAARRPGATRCRAAPARRGSRHSCRRARAASA